MGKEYTIKEMFYDEDGNLNIRTQEGKLIQFTNPKIESIDLGGVPSEDNCINIQF